MQLLGERNVPGLRHGTQAGLHSGPPARAACAPWCGLGSSGVDLESTSMGFCPHSAQCQWPSYQLGTKGRWRTPRPPGCCRACTYGLYGEKSPAGLQRKGHADSKVRCSLDHGVESTLQDISLCGGRGWKDQPRGPNVCLPT